MSSDKFPAYRGKMKYVCLDCHKTWPGDQLYYACPDCNGVLLLKDEKFDELKKIPGSEWQSIFDQRQQTRLTSLKGIFRFYELMAPVFEKEDIVYLGEANTPIVDASRKLVDLAGCEFAFKNEGQNPSASFKDRGMACAFSCLKWLIRLYDWQEVLTVCASTGDTSAAAALYASYVGEPVKSVVLLPEGKVTPQQLSQPLGSGAIVIELPGVFDDCMKVVEILAEKYRVALLNSKNSWRILGQESYAYETAQWANWQTDNICVFVPVGNAGNITAIMSGFLKLHALNIIPVLPCIVGVQSRHANPVFKYYSAPPSSRQWRPVKVSPSVAQAAMIGNPVSFPRVRMLAEQYMDIGGGSAFRIIEVEEQEIMDAMLLANRNGHIACTQGGECLAALIKASKSGLLKSHQKAVLDSTAHMLKFADFQNLYFENRLEANYGIKARQDLINRPEKLFPGSTSTSDGNNEFYQEAARKIASFLNLGSKQE